MIDKLIRSLGSLLPVAPGREGSCNGCGECCKLPYRCPALREAADGTTSCGAYLFRPPTCRKFPRTAAQLRGVADVCSFTFVPQPPGSHAMDPNIISQTVKQTTSTSSLPVLQD